MMLPNYLQIACRQLWRNRLFSLLNITGLTVGLAVSTFIALYVWHEFHYDRFHPFADRTFRILSVSRYGEQEVTSTGLHESFGREVRRLVPEVEQVVRFSDGLGDVVLQSDPERRFKEENVGFADETLLTVMGFRLLYGDRRTALAEPGRIVLTRALAGKYFGNQNPVGKTITYDKHIPLTVSGVLDDLPTNSVLQFNALVSLRSAPALGPRTRQVYEEAGFLQTFLVLRPGADAVSVGRKLETVKAGVRFLDKTATYGLEPLPSLHLDSRLGSTSSRQTLYIFISIALAILGLAIINYVSLTTARATQRAREVGVRKAIGGQRRELMGQFFTESFLMTTLAFGCSVLLLRALFPWANESLDLRMDHRVLQQGSYWGLMLGLWLGCSLLSGSYPALLLSGFRPHDVLKGSLSSGRQGAGMRRVFTTVQFSAAIGLLICSFVLLAQMRYLRTKHLGIDRAQVVSLAIDGDMERQFPAFRDAVRQWAGEQNVAVTNTALFTNRLATYFLETRKTKKQLMVNVLSVDASFFRTLGLRWAQAPVGWAQRPVTKPLQVFNQTALREAGFRGNPLGQPDPFFEKPIDGVVADFHLQSLHGTVAPMMLEVVSDTARALVEGGGYLLVRLAAQTDVPQALDRLKTLYEQQRPGAPFDYYFLDDAYNRLYEKENRLSRLFNAFTVLTLLVACLGLLGLMTFNVEARTKEIGIRKVLGASVTGIVALLSRDFLRLLALALLLASPVAWWAMDRWLADFAYKIDIEWWVFALAGTVTVGVALLTVGFQTVKAALMNPAESLKEQ